MEKLYYIGGDRYKKKTLKVSEVDVWGETRVSHLVGEKWKPLKVNKKTLVAYLGEYSPTHRQYYESREAAENYLFNVLHAYDISQEVRVCDNAELLKSIVETLNLYEKLGIKKEGKDPE